MTGLVMRRLQAGIAAIAGNLSLYEEINYAARAEALDWLDFRLAEGLESLPGGANQAAPVKALHDQAEQVKGRLEAIDKSLFRRLRADIRSGVCRGAELRRCIISYSGYDAADRRDDAAGYDSADAFINDLLLAYEIPGETIERQPDMVAYQPAPLRIILDMLDQDDLNGSDVFYDIGSGLGRVALLVSLLTGCRAKGIEVEPAFCRYARRCAAELGLSSVEFIEADAREADYTSGTVFFMYTPFRGAMLHTALETLRRQSQPGIRLYTYGPCTPEVARCAWLQRLDGHGDNTYRLATFIRSGTCSGDAG